jgi:hypothetical protein
MKKSLLIISLMVFICFSVDATDYFIASNGNDGNNGTSQSTPWKSIDKLNAYFSNLKPGDRVLFRRGDTFYGGITVNKSGTAGAPITIGAYGSGEKPVITGFTTVNSWNNLGGNIWESSTAVSTLPYTNMVVVNGVNTAMGRWPNSTGPNTGYLTIKSASGNSLTSDQLGGSPNWTGASIVIRKERYVIERGNIISHSGSTINFAGENIYSTKAGFGFFIQNDARTLDLNGEWYYNPSTKKIRVYSIATPKDVKIPSVENLVFASAKSYIVIDDLAFTGANSDALYCVNYGNNLVVQNCDISFVGGRGVYTIMNTTTVQNNSINYINYSGIRTVEPNSLIQNNSIKSVNLFEGMEDQAHVRESASAGISTTGENSVINNNKLENCGYAGIKFSGANTKVTNNFVNTFLITKDDGGGIDMSSRERAKGSIIDGNIVLNAVGAVNGASGTSPDASGIMIDAYGSGITISNNTVANCVNIGIKLHGANNIVVKNNTTFNNGGQSWSKGGLELLSRPDYLVRNISLHGNIFFAKTAEQFAFFGSPSPSVSHDMKLFGSADNNFYAKPIDPNSAIMIEATSHSVQGWQAYSGQDANSKGAPKSISNINDLRFEYNAATSPRTIPLDGNYIDVKNVSYNGSITLAPFTSAVLIRNGTIQNQPPTANAGSDQIITLPTNTASLKGTGADSDGSVSSYNWSKLSGPSGGTITNSTSASTTITGLIQGTYVFVLKVTDNVGATGFDTIQVNVKAAVANTTPVVDAGAHQTIVLPVNSTSLNGSGSVEGGTISAYNWQKLSGPSSGIIVNASAATTKVTELVEGTYVFQLKVTDNRGTSNTADVQVKVTAPVNLLPALNPSNTVNGLDYKYYEERSFTVVPDFSKLIPIKTGSTNNFDISVAAKADNFAISFDGFINVPTDGQYTFYTNSDDGSMLYIDNRLVVNNDGRHGAVEKSGTIGLKAGKHSISVGFFQFNWDKSLLVSYSGPGISKRAIPNSDLFRPSIEILLPGLNYKYFEAGSFSNVPDFSKLTPKKIGIANYFDLSVADKADNYAISFDGIIDIPTDGQYTFYTNSDDGSMLYINNKLVVNNDGRHGAIEKSGSVSLKAGKHSISVGFFQFNWDKSLQVSYAGPGISKRAIPSSILFRNADDLLIAGNTFGGPLASTKPLKEQILDNLTELNISAYPNPFVSSITITLNGEAGDYKLQMLDAMGRILWTKKGSKNEGLYAQNFNTSTLEKGMYVLKIIQKEKTAFIKLVK